MLPPNLLDYLSMIRVVIPGLVIVFLAVPALGQGLRMSADFLPLEVGNRWVYAVTNEAGQKIAEVDVYIQDRTIIEGRSFYVFSRFPFATGFDPNRTAMIRHDRASSQYVRIDDDAEGALFLAESSAVQVVESSEAGLPLKFKLTLGITELVFERGVGIISATTLSDAGPQIALLTGARVGARKIGAGVPDRAASGAAPSGRSAAEQKVEALAKAVENASEKNPALLLDASPATAGFRFVLIARNTSDKLLAFNFTTSQNYDFVVSDPLTGREIWRWSRRMMFSPVIRAEALRPRAQWRWEIEWNLLDSEYNPVPAGQYRLVGVLKAREPFESEPLLFEIK